LENWLALILSILFLGWLPLGLWRLLFNRDFQLYVSSEDTASKIARRLELNPMPMGGKVNFVLPYDEGVFYGTQVIR